jgi:hypothetical protein
MRIEDFWITSISTVEYPTAHLKQHFSMLITIDVQSHTITWYDVLFSQDAPMFGNQEH